VAKQRGKRNRFQRLPPKVRAFVENRQYNNGYGDIDGLQQDLKERGHEIPRSTLGYINKYLKEQAEEISQKTKLTTSIINAVGGDAHNLGLATSLVLQNETQEMIAKLDLRQINYEELSENARIALFLKLSKAHRDTAEAIQIQQKAKIEFENRVKEKTKEAAQEVDKTVKEAGLSEAQADFIRKKILGIAQ
jgi:hypothetical protein